MVEARVRGSAALHAIVTPVDLVRVGSSLRALRIRGRLRQQDLADRAHVGRGDVGAIELGRGDRVTLGAVQRVADALGARLDLAVRWNGEQLDRLLDEAHAATVAAMIRRLESYGWTTAIEVSFSIWGERGSIDILAWHAATRTLLVVEVKSVLPDVQSLLHGLDRKARLGAEIGQSRGWSPAAVARLVAIAESPTSRGRVARHATVLDVALPVRGRELRAWLRDPTGPIAGLMFLSNASPGRTTHSTWRRERVRRPRKAAKSPVALGQAAMDKDSAAAGHAARSADP